MTPSRIHRLSLTHFRNYRAASLNARGDVVVLVGPNGAGKTNCLEAISFLSPGRGLRRATLEDVADNQGDGAWAVSAEVEGALGLSISRRRRNSVAIGTIHKIPNLSNLLLRHGGRLMSVSTSRVMEYNPFSQEFQADPFPVYRWMRDEAPVFYSEKWNWWALSRFEDARAAATDPQTFLSYEGIDIDDTAKDQSGPGFLPDIDNPRHDQIRRMIQPQLLPNRIAEREDAVRAVVRGLIDAWRHRGTVDLAQELAWPTPNEVFFDLLGLPAARAQGREQLNRWVHELKDRKPDDSRLTPVAKAATTGIQSYFTDLLHERRARPRADLVTHIVTAEIDGVPFAEEDFGPASEVLGLMMVLFLGGVESTAGLIGTLFKLLAENPDQRAILRGNPALIPDAVEEAIRLATPLQLVGRTASRDVTLHGVTIPAGAGWSWSTARRTATSGGSAIRIALRVERFSARPLTAPVRAEAFEVELTASELTLTIPPDRSILDVVEEAGVGVLSSCAEGTCGTCETAVLSGLPDHRDSVLTEEERRAGDCMMICVSRSARSGSCWTCSTKVRDRGRVRQ